MSKFDRYLQDPSTGKMEGSLPAGYTRAGTPEAIDYHMKSSDAHEKAGYRAMDRGDNEIGAAHIITASKHREAAAMHKKYAGTDKGVFATKMVQEHVAAQRKKFADPSNEVAKKSAVRSDAVKHMGAASAMHRGTLDRVERDVKLSDNPYNPGTKEHIEWRNGWYAGAEW